MRGGASSIVVNANGNSRKPLAKLEPLVDFDASVRSVRASLEDFPADLYVFLSSCDVYPDCSSPLTTDETMPLPVGAQSPYGFHKYLAEECVRHRARKWLVVRCGGFVGRGLKKNAVFDVLHGGPLWLDPASELQFVDTAAAAAIVMELADRGISNETVNLAGQGVIAISEVVDMARAQVRVQDASPVVRYDVSVAKLARWVDVPRTRDAVRRFVSDYREDMLP